MERVVPLNEEYKSLDKDENYQTFYVTHYLPIKDQIVLMMKSGATQMTLPIRLTGDALVGVMTQLHDDGMRVETIIDPYTKRQNVIISWGDPTHNTDEWVKDHSEGLQKLALLEKALRMGLSIL